jgi:polysaccharide biosynthesis transport protein
MNQEQLSQGVEEQKFDSVMGGGLSEESKLELLEYWHAVIRRKWAILGLGVLSAVVAGAVVFALPPVYSSSGTLLIEQNKPKIVSFSDAYGGVSQDHEFYQTQVEILKSHDIGMRVVKTLKLWDYPEFDPRKTDDSWLGKLKSSIGIGGAKPVWTPELLAEAAQGGFAARMSVEPVRLSQLIKVSFASEDRELAARVANAVADVYIEADQEAKLSATQRANTWLQEHTQSLRDKLQGSEQALQAYREKAGIISLSGSAQTMLSQQIAEVTQRLMDARAKRAEAESVYNQVKAIRDGDYTSVPAVIRNPSVAAAKQQETTASLKVAELQQRYGAEHTKMIQAQSELKAARDNLNRQMQAVVTSLTSEYETTRSTERELESALNAARGGVQNVNRQEFQLGVLEREVEANKQLYEMFMNRAKESNLGNDLTAAIARVVDPAVASNVPIKPKKKQVIGIALVLGLFFGILIAVLLEKLDNTVKGVEDAELHFHLPVLSAIPKLGSGDRKLAARMYLDKPDSHLAEAVRTARTGLLLSDLDATSRIVVVTSSVPGEGKTTVSTNLAHALAQTKHTLLIEADMRRPQLAHRLGLPAGARGLSNLVAGTASVEDCLFRIEGSSLTVMPVGDLPPNPQELLLSQKFQAILSNLAEQFEVILLDTPPVELVSDALILASVASSVIFVVQAMETPYPVVRKNLIRMQRVGGKILGVVINQLDFKKSYSYGDYSGYAKHGAYGAYGHQKSA